MEKEQTAAEARLTNETIEYLEQKMTQAVKDGIQSVLNEQTAELFWAAGFNVLQRQATQHAGRFVLGGMWELFRKLSMFLVLGGVVYALGGWTALAGLFRTLFSAH